MSVHFSKERMIEVLCRHEAWWQGTLGRPLINGLIYDAYTPSHSAKAPRISQANCHDFSWTPEEVIDQSVLYMRITFLGVPFMLLYNFGSAVLRALGDTRRPLYILFAAGVVNVLLNLITVIVFSMGVAGVAIATVSSHIISSALVLRCLVRSESAKLELKNLRIIPAHLLDIIKIGMPAQITSAFSKRWPKSHTVQC